jgi:hypothetical protein
MHAWHGTIPAARLCAGARTAADCSADRNRSESTPLLRHRRGVVHLSTLPAASRPQMRSESPHWPLNPGRLTLVTHELQSRALQVGPTPMTSSEMMTASSSGASPMFMGRSAKQRHSSVIAGSCVLSVVHRVLRSGPDDPASQVLILRCTVPGCRFLEWWDGTLHIALLGSHMGTSRADAKP